MKILSFDTTMAACSAAVVDTDAASSLATAFVPMERGHAEALPPMVSEVLQLSGLDIRQIDRIAVTTGPGTFTGVRIGLAFARGIGLARGIPVIGIDSLTAIAANESSTTPLLVVSDARNEDVYTALFDGHRRLIGEPHVSSAAAAAFDAPSETLVLGTASKAVIAASGRSDLALSAVLNLPVAAQFARLAMSIAPAEMPSPLYLRAPDAKPQSSALRKIAHVSIESVGVAASEVLSRMHGEVFDEGWSERDFAAMLETPGTDALIASNLGEPVGFLVTRRAADEAEIIAIGARPSMQRRGVARQLLQSHMRALAANGIRQLFLEVRASNAAAQGLYRACGFAEAGRRRGYYRRSNGVEDAVIMRRELNP